MRQLWHLLVIGIVVGTVLGIPVRAGATAHQERVANIRQVLQENGVNGIVLVNGSPQRAQVVGNQTTSDPQQVVQANRLFPIASFQKLMTGMAIMHLVDQGRLSLTTPLSCYLPRVAHAHQISIERLMMHMSGLDNQSVPLKRPLRGTAAQEEYLLHHYSSSGQFTWNYADIDFSILAMVVRRCSRQSYLRFLNDRVLHPAGVQVKLYNQVRPGQVTRSMGTGDWNGLQVAMSTELGAGDVFCTPQDYWRFYHQCLLKRPRWLHQFVAKQSPDGKETYFGGTYIEPPYLHANGYLDGYSCTLYSNYRTQQTIMLFANNLSYHQLRVLSGQLYHAYFGDYREEQPQINN